jgi:hypothetical protein
VVTLQPVQLAEAMSLACQASPAGGTTAQVWESFRRQRGLLAFAATDGGTLVGLAIVESASRVLHVWHLDGTREACRLLLHRLILLAGERDVSVSCSADRTDLRRLLGQEGFVLLDEDHVRGLPLCRYLRPSR